MCAEVNSIKVVRGPNILYRLGLLVFRSTIMQLRDPMLIPARFVQALFLSIIVGLLYLQVRMHTPPHTQARAHHDVDWVRSWATTRRASPTGRARCSL